MPDMTAQEALKKFGMTLQTRLTQYKSDRRLKDLQMLQDLRQYRAEYDPTTKKELADANRSMVYPRDSRLKLVGAVSKMMEMMFPAAEKNWSIAPTEYPNISKEDLDSIIRGATARKTQEAPGEPLTSDDIESAVQSFAKTRALNMEREIEDQLSEMPVEYPHLCKRNLHSGHLYGWGVVAGPFTVMKEERVYEQTANGWEVVVKKVPRPQLESRRTWDIYPDMSAKHWRQQEGLFDRHVMSRHDLTALVDREDFMGDAIKEYLSTHDEGNYKAEPYEAELRVLDQTMNVQKIQGRRYEVYRYFGFVSAKELSAIGVPVPETEMYKDILVDVWFISGEGEGTIIKAEQAVFGNDVGDQYHPYFYDDEEEAGLLGVSQMSIIRDSQLQICSVSRMIMDNAAACLGPITEIDRSRLTKDNKDPRIGAFSNIYVDHSEQPSNPRPVLQSFQPDSHISELLAVKKDLKQVMDMESNVQPVSLGDPTGVGEAFRTSGNFSQLTGSANMMTKDQVRAFDRYTSSVIGALLRWNLQFTEKPEIKGDFQAIARGNISLVAKEVRGAALAQWRMTLTPREQVLLKTRDLMLEELKSRDLPIDILLTASEGAKALAAYDAAQSKAQELQQGAVTAKTQKDTAAAGKAQAEAQEILAGMREKINAITQQANLALAKVTESNAKAKGLKNADQLNTVKLLLDQINNATGAGSSPAGNA